MKKYFLIVAISLLVSDSWCETISIGQPTPHLQITSLDGKSELLIGGKSDKVYLINFWATWCAPCKEEMPQLETFYQKYKSQGLEVIAISMDDPKKIENAKEYGKQFSFVISHMSKANVKELGRLWRLPSTFLIDKNGLLQKNGHLGDAVVTNEELERLVAPLLVPN
jgi:thiol-disulfide isomerase/thioredoxin